MSKATGPSVTDFNTKAIHAGQEPDSVTGAVCVPISLATTFVQKSVGVHTGYEYSRTGNPTRHAYERCIAELEGAEYGVAFSSGSAATMTILSMLNTGDHIVSVDDVYGGTNRYFRQVAAPCNGFKFTFADLTVPGALEEAITSETKLVWLETPTNPTLKISDIEACAKVCKAKGVMLVVDNTFMSPYFQNPILLGADMVVHSISKFINGHSDIIGGIVLTSNPEIKDKLKFLQNSIGAVPSPFDAYMIMRGVKTLHLRMERHGINAMAVAKLLEGHPKVEKVLYPGLPSHPQHELACRQMSGFGGMVTFYVKGGLSESSKFLESLKVFALAESLGAVESLAEHPVLMTHAAVPAEQRKALGISDSLVRISVGLEDLDLILEDLNQALAAI